MRVGAGAYARWGGGPAYGGASGTIAVPWHTGWNPAVLVGMGSAWIPGDAPADPLLDALGDADRTGGPAVVARLEVAGTAGSVAVCATHTRFPERSTGHVRAGRCRRSSTPSFGAGVRSASRTTGVGWSGGPAMVSGHQRRLNFP